MAEGNGNDERADLYGRQMDPLRELGDEDVRTAIKNSLGVAGRGAGRRGAVGVGARGGGQGGEQDV